MARISLDFLVRNEPFERVAPTGRGERIVCRPQGGEPSEETAHSGRRSGRSRDPRAVPLSQEHSLNFCLSQYNIDQSPEFDSPPSGCGVPRTADPLRPRRAAGFPPRTRSATAPPPRPGPRRLLPRPDPPLQRLVERVAGVERLFERRDADPLGAFIEEPAGEFGDLAAGAVERDDSRADRRPRRSPGPRRTAR